MEGKGIQNCQMFYWMMYRDCPYSCLMGLEVRTAVVRKGCMGGVGKREGGRGRVGGVGG